MENNNIPENENINSVNNEPVDIVTPDEITVSAMEQEIAPKKKKPSVFKSRKFKYGSLSTALIALVVVVVIAANMLLSALSDRFSWSFDFTSNNLYKLSDATKETVQSIDPDTKIEITVMYPQTTYPSYFSEPIKRFANLSNNITVNYIDPEKNPTALTEYDEEYGVASASVIIRNGDRFRVFNIDDYCSYDQETGATSIFLEDKLSAGLLYVTKDLIPTVYFLNAHGESGYGNLMNTIDLKGAEVKELNLLKDIPEFDDSSKIMVISNPTTDYSESEIRIIEDFLNNNNEFGRNLMFFSSPGAPELPNLEAFLKSWGIVLNDDLVLEGEDMSMMQQANQMAVAYTTEEIGNSLVHLYSSSSDYIFVPNSRSLTDIFNGDSGTFRTQPLLTTTTSSYSRDINVGYESLDRITDDEAGPFDVGLMSMKYKYDSNNSVESYVCAFGSTEIISNENFVYYGNSEVFSRIYKIMVDETDDILNDARKSTSSPLASITSTQEDAFLYIAVIGLPLLIIIVGAVITTRRRFL